MHCPSTLLPNNNNRRLLQLPIFIFQITYNMCNSYNFATALLLDTAYHASPNLFPGPPPTPSSLRVYPRPRLLHLFCISIPCRVSSLHSKRNINKIVTVIRYRFPGQGRFLPSSEEKPELCISIRYLVRSLAFPGGRKVP